MDYRGSAMMPPVYFVWIAVTIAACISACASLGAHHACRDSWRLNPDMRSSGMFPAWARSGSVTLSADSPTVVPLSTHAGYIVMWVVLRSLGSSAYSLLPQTQRDVAFINMPSGHKGGAPADPLPSRSASLAAEELSAVELGKGDVAASGGSFVTLRSQGSMHMRTDSANESRSASPGAEAGWVYPRASPFSVAAARPFTAEGDW